MNVEVKTKGRWISGKKAERISKIMAHIHTNKFDQESKTYKTVVMALSRLSNDELDGLYAMISTKITRIFKAHLSNNLMNQVQE
jgi:hypothetical protein